MLIGLVLCQGSASTSWISQRTAPVSVFLDSIGTQSNIASRGENFDKSLECVKYLGVRWLRGGIEGLLTFEQYAQIHRETGIRFSWGLGSGGTDLDKLIETARPLAQAGMLLAFEGPNEPNNWGITYGGQNSREDKTWVPIARLQRDLYARVHGDPAFKGIPVWSISEAGAEVDNVGLQFLQIPSWAETKLPAGTMFADFVNVHNYIYHPNSPFPVDNKTWNAADPGPLCKVDGLYGEHGVTWARHFPGYSPSQLETLPRVTTETGCLIEGPVTERVQALNILSMYLDQFKRGWSHTATYLLRDRVDEAGNQTFGFYDPQYRPRLSAVYLHNLTTILRDSGRVSRTGSLKYAIDPLPETVHSMVLKRSDGTRFLVVWDERVKGEDKLVVRFSYPVKAVQIYDPTLGLEPVERFRDRTEVSVTLSDHPLILELA